MQKINFLVVDIESTCFQDDDADKPYGWATETHQEVIEIGCVLLNTFDEAVVAERSFLIKPEGPIGIFCSTLTGYEEEHLRYALPLKLALIEFIDWCSENKFDLRGSPWGSWGDYDRVQLFRECVRKNLYYPFGRTHYNIKNLYSLRRRVRKGLGVSKALNKEGLEFEGTPHKGLDDAKNIARLLLRIL